MQVSFFLSLLPGGHDYLPLVTSFLWIYLLLGFNRQNNAMFESIMFRSSRINFPRSILIILGFLKGINVSPTDDYCQIPTRVISCFKTIPDYEEFTFKTSNAIILFCIGIYISTTTYLGEFLLNTMVCRILLFSLVITHGNSLREFLYGE